MVSPRMTFFVNLTSSRLHQKPSGLPPLCSLISALLVWLHLNRAIISERIYLFIWIIVLPGTSVTVIPAKSSVWGLCVCVCYCFITGYYLLLLWVLRLPFRIQRHVYDCLRDFLRNRDDRENKTWKQDRVWSLFWALMWSFLWWEVIKYNVFKVALWSLLRKWTCILLHRLWLHLKTEPFTDFLGFL